MATELHRQEWPKGRLVLQGSPDNLIVIGQAWKYHPTLVGSTLRLARLNAFVDLAIEIAPGMKLRPRFLMDFGVDLSTSQLADYNTFRRSMRGLSTPINPP